MNESGESAPKIKVVDRRRFTEDGAPRTDRPRAPEQEPGEPAASDSQPPHSPAETSREFVELVAMLAQQAELMMVGAEGFEPHPDEARRLIDSLGVLEAKTRGNLSREEAKILEDVLFQLRSLFVQGRR